VSNLPCGQHARMARSGDLGLLARLFLRLGFTAFGGPAAHIAMMEDEVVRRRQWLSHDDFLDMISACNLIPGPNSTEMAIHIGQRRAGFTGLAIAGLCFITPAALITIALAWVYVTFGRVPQIAGVLYGIKPVIIAIVVQAIARLARSVLRTPLLIGISLAATAAALLGVDEMVILLAVGALVIVARRLSSESAPSVAASSALGAASAGAAAAVPFSLGALFVFFLKVGAVLFGSGYVLLAFLQADLVDRRRWLTQSQLLDAVAIGQITPGPVSSTATFVGYLLGGTRGAAVATVGIFLPAFFFVSLSGPLLPRLRRSPTAGAFLDGVNAGSFALMVAVTWQLARAAIFDRITVIVAIVAAILLLRFQLNSAWLILFGAVVGGAAAVAMH
jgi:chromate transporter